MLSVQPAFNRVMTFGPILFNMAAFLLLFFRAGTMHSVHDTMHISIFAHQYDTYHNRVKAQWMSHFVLPQSKVNLLMFYFKLHHTKNVKFCKAVLWHMLNASVKSKLKVWLSNVWFDVIKHETSIHFTPFSCYICIP